MTELSEALGRGKDLELGGQTLHVDPLNFADLADLEEALEADPHSEQELSVIEALTQSHAPNASAYQNPLSRLKPMKLAHQLLILHLCLRKAQPDMTRAKAAMLISAKQYQKPETAAFLSEVLQISGVMSEGAKPSDDAPETAKLDTAKAAEPKKPRTRSANTVA